ncbi:thermonuclease family protein [Mycoplasma phocoeninasale]|uniref:thermonuclease family protein n=1 Tax=Mycoplasma phocoeninasale TaxID=2726117 RepID=UPI0019684896|nr:thermonuclease family protein [Mycoplasma phocoeninasale]MBN0970643.1 thermonuclease family protein [Mycoplasma phocoeninasale]
MKHKKIFLGLTLTATFIPVAAISCTVKENKSDTLLKEEILQLKQMLVDHGSAIIEYEKISADISSVEQEINQSQFDIKLINEQIKEIKNKLKKYIDDKLEATNFKFEINNLEFKIDKARDISNWNIEIADGDTIRISVIRDGKFPEMANIRFAGVDTPETHKRKNGNFIDTTGEQFKYGKIAEFYTKRIIQNAKKVFIVPQKTKSKTNKGKDKDKQFLDPYNRIVGIVYYQDKNDKIYCLNEQLVYYGFARMSYISLSESSTFYTANVEYFNSLEKAKEHAINNHLGIYANDNKFKEIFPTK